MMKKMNKISKHLAKLLMIGVLSSLTLSSISQAAVVYVDNFDSTTPITLNRLLSSATPQQPWVKTQYAFSTTTSVIDGGFLNVSTDSIRYGGAATRRSALFDFFKNELSITLRGVSFQPSSTGNVGSQGVQFGVGAALTGMNRNNLWTGYSAFGVTFYGSGRFDIFAQNRVMNSVNVQSVLQQIPTPYLNFTIADLTAVKITLDDVNYRVVFEFGNVLNILSIAGPHSLRLDLWGASNIMRIYAIQKTTAEADLATAQASGDPTAIADAQAALAAVMVNYNAQFAIEQAVMGESVLFVGATSADGRGVNASIDSVTVETTTDLAVLR